MTKIKFGVWGFGRMGALHGKFYAMEQDKFKLVAACDTDEEKLNSAKTEYQCAVYTDQKAFLADPDMELVVISTLSLDHVCHALEALESGKSVLLDKPIAITDDELETLRQADKKYPGKLFVLHNLRFEPGFETVQKIIARGVLGEISLIKLRRHHRNHFFRSDWQTLLEFGGGLLNNWGNHEIDHAVQLLGSHAVDVWSQLWHVSSGGNGDDHVKIILRGNNNRVADLEISNNVTLPEPYCTVYGQKGSLVCNASLNEVNVRYIDPEFTMPELCIETNTAVYNNCLEKDIPWIEETIKVESGGNMWEYIDRKLIKYLYDDIKNGVSSPIKNNDAFETIRIIQEVKKQNSQFDWIK
jgi:predicted dehydrogenase